MWNTEKKVHSTEQMPFFVVNNTKLNDSENVTALNNLMKIQICIK
jgi:hypothetical protein